MTALKTLKILSCSCRKICNMFFNYEIVQNVGYDYKDVIFIKYLFYHVGDQEMTKTNDFLTQMK